MFSAYCLVLHGCNGVKQRWAHLRVVHTWDWLAVQMAAVVVVACAVGGGAGHGAFCGDTPAGGLVQQGAATIK